VLIQGEQASRFKAAKLLRRLAVYGGDAERFIQMEDLQDKQQQVQEQQQAQYRDTGGMLGGFLSAFSLAAPTQVRPAPRNPNPNPKV
jgi:hypothetical protein